MLITRDLALMLDLVEAVALKEACMQMLIPEEGDKESALMDMLRERSDPAKKATKPPASMKIAPSPKQLRAELDLAKAYLGEVSISPIPKS